jgi:hypothetical protein
MNLAGSEISLLSAGLLVSLAWGFGCSDTLDATGSDAKDLRSPPDARAPARVFERSIRAGTDNEVELTVMPNATCQLHEPSSMTPDDAIELYSDDAGYLSFMASPDEPGGAGDLELDCVDDSGKSSSYRLHLKSTADPVASPQRPVRGTRRPPLTGDPNAFTNAQLLSLGFPPRPSPAAPASAHREWERMARQPATLLFPRLVKTPRRADVATDIWAGYSTTSPGPYAQIQGTWTVPLVSGEVGVTDVASLWIGLNTNADGLWQAGTLHDVRTIKFLGMRLALRSNSAFFELLPAGASQLAGFPANPGQQMNVWVWMGDAIGNVDANGAYGWWFIENATAGVGTCGYVPLAGTNTNYVSGIWIAERYKTHAVEPPYNHLANFGTVTLSRAYAGTASGAWPYSWLGPAAIAMTEPSTGHTLAQAYADPVDGAALRLVWRNFN